MNQLRRVTEEYELKFLAPYAIKSVESKGREIKEEDDINRTCFQRDRDRIFFCSSFRKLQFKTQVFIIREGQSYRNRYIHTMQVALHSRTLARLLRVNEDLCEAIAYAHDIGHPPFGHAGEEQIKYLSRQKGNFEFEHNIQSLRIVSNLEKRDSKNGLNLCFETREGIALHRTISDKPNNIPSEFRGYKSPSIEAQIVNVADEIAFTVHDLYDALQTNIISNKGLEILKKIELWKLSSERFGKLTHILIKDVLDYSIKKLKCIQSPDEVRDSDILCDFSPDIKILLRKLQNFLFDYVYKSPIVSIMDEKGKKIIYQLFNKYWDDPNLLPDEYKSRLDYEEKTRVIVDFLSSLTDVEAIELHRNFFNLYHKFKI